MPTIQKTYQAKIFSPSGAYMGLLPNWIQDFTYNQNIATTFAQCQLTVAQDSDVASLPITPITDENGNAITDENGNSLLIERQPDIVGSSNSNAFIANNNQIQIYEYSQYYPNGLLVFSGYISKWKTVFGVADNIIITCLSQGTDMNNILVSSGDVTYISQTTDDGSSIQVFNTTTSAEAVMQTFSVPTATSIGAAAFELTITSATAQVGYILHQQIGTQPDITNDPILTYGYATPGIITKQVQKISFNQPTTLIPNNTYYIEIYWVDSSTLTVFANSTRPYGAGTVYSNSFFATSWGTNTSYAWSLYFVIYQHGGSVTGTYTNDDPSFILTDVMNNYVTNGGQCAIPPSTITPLISQLYKDNTIVGGFWSTAYAQIITPGKTMTFDTVQYRGDVGSNVDNLTVQLYRGDPSLDSVVVTSGTGVYTLGGSNTLIATSNTVALSSLVDAAVTLTFATPQTLTGGTQYYLLLFFNQGQSVSMLLDTASANDPITDSQVGKLYLARITSNNTSAAMAYNSSFPAMFFQIGLGAGTNPAGGYSNTGTLTSYTFRMQTVLQAIQAIISLAPANWYWYVDPATNILQFAQENTSADITLIKGRHINSLDIEATKETIKNDAYFTGGDDGTGTNTNILVRVQGTQGSNRKGLALLSDNRVNSTSGSTVTAKLIAQNYLNNNSAETYITNATIQDGTMDINQIKLGMMVGFAGFGNFVEGLLLQVVGITRRPDQVDLQLGTLPLRDSKVIAIINTALAAQQTVAVPSVPS